MKSLFTALGISVCLYGCAQTGAHVDVPAVVKTKFATMYPGAGHTVWEMEDGNYEAEFKVDKVETSAIYNGEGILQQTESEMEVALLPQSVRDYVSSTLGNKKIDGAAKIVHQDGKLQYEAEVDKKDFIFDANGQFVGQEEDDKGKEEEDD
ncbi:MAG: hypothetical protein M3R25_01140 [Bacteroidota bacterium]|nr:hypothetical protein [Bacteroidota bacterium]